MIFSPPPIKAQIRQYVAWKAVRYPVAASSHERVLRDFFRKMHIRCASSVSPDMVDAYLKDIGSTYLREQAVHVLRQFFKYWTEMGLLVKEVEQKLPQEVIPVIREPVMNVEQAKRVQRLTKPKGEGGLGMSLRQAKLKMETEDGKTYHLKQIHRWSRYKLYTPQA